MNLLLLIQSQLPILINYADNVQCPIITYFFSFYYDDETYRSSPSIRSIATLLRSPS
jgi:hypothetical protein